MKTVLVTGGAGFIGSHLCKFLLDKNYKVICVDNFCTGSSRNIDGVKNNKDFQIIDHDITLPLKIPGEVHYILHFASPASPADYAHLPIETLKVGALGTHNALGIAKAKKAVFMLASTSEVYGDPLVHPQHESYWGNVNQVGPRGQYDEAKRFAEAMTMAYNRTQNVDTKIARIFNTFGPYMREKDGRAVPNFITQALLNDPITVYGDGSQTRSFMYITDLVDGIYKLMLAKTNEPVNLGNPLELNILQLAKKIIFLSKSKSEIVHMDLPIDDPKNRCPDISKAKSHLNWTPSYDVELGLRKTIEWFRKI